MAIPLSLFVYMIETAESKLWLRQYFQIALHEPTMGIELTSYFRGPTKLSR
jgi:hypothetical protein